MNIILYEECEILKLINIVIISILDKVILWNFFEDDFVLFDIRFVIIFVVDEEECLDDIWIVEEDFEILDRSDIGFENISKESDISGMLLFEGVCLILGVSMLLVIIFVMCYSIIGVVLVDLFLFIEVYFILFNYFGYFMKLLCDFFKKLKNLIEFYYYCLFCYEYIGVKRYLEYCINKYCL